ncbi:tetratricopeptide repeat protein [Candidatus Chlorohelix sp.]|uniref:tetratricopeptide repeat protein n=1 Tax=Candidatus Chlorohelix sp. TaxID=3139201 RepID=UPI00306B58A4
MTQYQPEDKHRIKRQKTELSIRLAREGKWEEAVNVNQELLSIFPDDSEALNRLGKACLELRRFSEAKEAYEKALKNDPGNSIAQKNLQRLAQAIAENAALSKSGKTPAPAHNSGRSAADPSSFIEETGKTGLTTLREPGKPVVLAKLTAGDLVYLEVDSKNQALYVKNAEGEMLGQVEPKLALRLVRFIEGGNRYSAAVTSVTDKQLTIIIREVFQHPNQRGRLSFPARHGGVGYRAYIKDSVLRYGFEDEDEMLDDNDRDDGDAEDNEEEIDMSEEYLEEPESDEL